MSAMARLRLSSSCSRAVASSSSSKSIPSSLLPRRIYTLPSRPLLLSSSLRASPLSLPLPPPTPARSSFATVAAVKGSSAPSSSVSPTQQQSRSTREGSEMTVSSSVKLAGGTLSVCGRTVLSGVPDSVVASSAAAGGAVDGIFIGADFAERNFARHVVSLGDLRGVRFMACFRFKLWWMAQRMGENGGDVPRETQFLLVESKGRGAAGDEAAAYVAPVGPVAAMRVAAWERSARVTTAEPVVERAVTVTERVLAKRIPGAAATEITTRVIRTLVIVATTTSAAGVGLQFVIWDSTVVIPGLEFLSARDTLVVGVHPGVEGRQLPKNPVQLGVHGHRIGGDGHRRHVRGGLWYQN